MLPDGGTGACALAGGAGSCPSDGQGCICWCVCELSMTLGSLSANGCVCVPLLPVALHEASSSGACWLLGGARS